MGIEDSINLYHYLFNNPFRYVDPDGQCPLAIPIFITLFEFALPTFTVALPTLTQIGVAVGIAIVATAGYEVTKKANEWDERRMNNPMLAIGVEEENSYAQSEKKKKPPYNGQQLGNDPTKPPGEGFQWKGRDKPGTKDGSWVKGVGKTKEILYPDLEHPDPIGPHWDYTGPEFPEGARLYPNGSWETKL